MFSKTCNPWPTQLQTQHPSKHKANHSRICFALKTSILITPVIKDTTKTPLRDSTRDKWEEYMEDTYRVSAWPYIFTTPKKVNPNTHRRCHWSRLASRPQVRVQQEQQQYARINRTLERARSYQQPTKHSGNQLSPLTLSGHPACPAPRLIHLTARFSLHANRTGGEKRYGWEGEHWIQALKHTSTKAYKH